MTSKAQELSPSEARIARRRTVTMLFSIMVIATNGVIYELLIAGYSSYLLGDSITQFSLTIGIFLSSMGVGSWLTQRLEHRLEERFVQIEIALALFGGPAILFLAMAHIYTRFYVWVMFGMIILLGALIGFEIPLVTRVVHQYGDLKKAIANVLSFDYIGALFGSLLFPLVLLPYFGFARTSFLIGLVNLGIAFLNLVVFHEQFAPKHRRWWALSILIGIGLLIGTLYSAQWIEEARERASGQRLVFLQHTPYQTIRFVQDERHPKRPYRLFLNGEHQLSSDSERRYHEALVHPAIAAAGSAQRILLLGGGDGLALRELWRVSGVREVVLVDLDPAMTRWARTHPVIRRMNRDALQDPRVRIIHQDAYQFLQRNRRPFDLAIIDLPVPTQIALSKLYTRSFYKALWRNIKPDGVATTEAAVLDPIERRPFWCIVATQRSAHWSVYPYTDGPMAFTLMAKHPLKTNTLSLKTASLHYLSNPRLHSLFHTPNDVALATSSPINTLETHALMYLVLALRNS